MTYKNNKETVVSAILLNFGKQLLFVFIFLISFLGNSQVKATIDTTTIKIGEEMLYHLEVVTDSSSIVVFPEGQSFLPLEVIEFYPTDTTFENQKTKLIKKYGLTQFDSGKYVIPRQLLRINQKSFYTDSLLVEVADVEVDTLKQKMFDIKPAIAVPAVKTNWLRYVFWGLFILAVLALLIYLFIKQKKKIKEAKKQLPPFEEALVALKTLDTSDYLKENRVKDYYTSLTEIVKRYLDREVDEAALESTTDELILKLELYKDSGHLDFDRTTINKLREILKRADLIKFAKMQMESGQAQLDRTDIEEIIKETHESIPEPTEEEKLKDALYQEELLKKKQTQKRRKMALGIASFLILVVVISSFVFGIDRLKDTIFGNYTRSLAQGQWIQSDYGSPAILLESPEPLLRKNPNEALAISQNPDDVFSFGDIQKKLFIYVASEKIQNPSQENLEQLLEEKLQMLEQAGATNLLVLDEPFTTQKGVTGIKASGEFNISLGKNKFKKEKSEYELILFSQQGSIQALLLVTEKEDIYAQQIKERVLNSVEIEVLK